MKRGRSTLRQRTFARAYLETGCAATAARAAGYVGRYAAQAGYKLLHRKGVQTEVKRRLRVERLLLRRDLRRGVQRVREALDRLDIPRDAPTQVLEQGAGPLVRAMHALGLG